MSPFAADTVASMIKLAKVRETGRVKLYRGLGRGRDGTAKENQRNRQTERDGERKRNKEREKKRNNGGQPRKERQR